MIYGRIRTAQGTWRGFYADIYGLSWYVSTGRPVWWLPRVEVYGSDKDLHKIGCGFGWLVLAVGVSRERSRKQEVKS